MEKLINLIKSIGPFTEDDLQAIDKVSTLAKTITLKKGDFLCSEGELVDFFAFVSQGLLRHFILDSSENEKIIQFYKEYDFMWDSNNYSARRGIVYSVQAIEDSRIITIGYEELHREMGHLPSFSTIGAQIMNWAAEIHQEHLMMVMKYTPQERYHYLLQNKPEFIQRISVTHLSQFLNLSRETLSRLRAKVGG